MIRFIIHEMEDTLVEVRTTAARTIAEKKENGRSSRAWKKHRQHGNARRKLALSKDREDLAKGALVEKARLAEAAKLLASELSQIDAALTQHDDDVAKLQSKLAEAKAKQKTIQTRQDTATRGSVSAANCSTSASRSRSPDLNKSRKSWTRSKAKWSL